MSLRADNQDLTFYCVRFKSPNSDSWHVADLGEIIFGDKSYEWKKSDEAEAVREALAPRVECFRAGGPSYGFLDYSPAKEALRLVRKYGTRNYKYQLVARAISQRTVVVK